MFRLVNAGGRPALEHDGGGYDVARLADDDSLADRRRRGWPAPRSSTTSRGAAVEPSPTARWATSSSAHRCPDPGRSSPSASTTPTTPPRAAWSPRRRR